MMKFISALLPVCTLMALINSAGCDAPNPEALSERYAEQFVVAAAVKKENLIDCHKGFCDATYQFCLRSTVSRDSKSYKPAYCRPRAKECDTCDCATKEAQKHFSMAKNCKGEILCTQEDSRIVVTCVVPPWAIE